MSTRHSLLAGAAGVALAGCMIAGCAMPIDRSLGAFTGDFMFTKETTSATIGVSYKEQYRTHEAYVLSLSYSNPRDWDALVLRADLISYGRIPEAGGSATYVGFGLGLASWTADSPTGHASDFWLRIPIGMQRRFLMDNGEVFLELAPQLGLDGYFDYSTITFGGGVRWKIGY